MVLLDGDKVISVPNGTDGVLFISPPNARPWCYLPERKDDRLFDQLVLPDNYDNEDNCLTPEQSKLAIRAWVLGGLLHKGPWPLLLLEGEKGSGKTTAGRSVMQFVYGPDAQVSSMPAKEEDFDALVTNVPMAVIDNVDSPAKWQQDKLAVTATGAEIPRRKLYSTNVMVNYPITARVILTSINPPFRRSDIADRMVVIKLKRFDTFGSEEKRYAEIERKRDYLWTELVNEMNELIHTMKSGYTSESTLRMATYEETLNLIGENYELPNDIVEATVKGIMSRQNDFTTENSILAEIIDEYLDCKKDKEVKRITVTQLFRELQEMSSWENASTRYVLPRTSNVLGKELRSIAPGLKRKYGILVELARNSKNRYLTLKKLDDTSDVKMTAKMLS